MKWMRRYGVRSWLQLLVLLVIDLGTVSLARSAAAASETLDEAGLQLDLGDTPRCVIWPRRLQVPADCAGVDLGAAGQIEASNRSESSLMQMLAMVVWKPPGAEVLLVTIGSMPPAAPTREFVGDYVAGVYNSLHSPENALTRGDDPRLRHDRITVAGAPAIRYATGTFHGGHQILSYLVFAEKRTYALGMVIPTSDGARGRALADALLATIRLPGTPARAPHSTYFIGFVLGALLLTGILSRMMWRRSGRPKPLVGRS